MTQEENIPVACRQIKAVNNGSTLPTLYYLNSVLDWGTSSLHQLLIDHPDYRLKDAMGQDIIAPLPGSPWCFNLSVPALREAWILDCLNTVTSSDGCDGCFVDRSNNMTEFHVTTSVWNMSLPEAMQFEISHMHTLSELNTRLAAIGGFAVSNNQGLSEQLGTSSIMFEDFTGSEHCITSLRRAASSGLVVQVHAGYIVDDGSNDTFNGCGSGDTNAMAAFLIGMGNYTYYHCAKGWTSDRRWPVQDDVWLDWREEYDRPLGRPLGDAIKSAIGGGIWQRNFSLGTYVEFDGEMGNGTIWWGDGVVQTGLPSGDIPKKRGCRWQSLPWNIDSKFSL
eukprot:CAMPEP_0195509626 /NCGR_PEP_ID=MMETSP0794_2-20130614/2511_1 /TAXON_ID=515487 /ORGANISM="Stephanopyxis turris, Strain CCMP 815" /LENGTH=335 /DNA_ID=CAMNT_0040636897 /DNA_START=237 /DNA_END=1244 /DNA_ORIENTATION=-